MPNGYLLSALNRWNYVGNDDFYVSFGVKATMEDKLAGSFNSDDFEVKLKIISLSFLVVQVG